jgi:hypothetical protein
MNIEQQTVELSPLFLIVIIFIKFLFLSEPTINPYMSVLTCLPLNHNLLPSFAQIVEWLSCSIKATVQCTAIREPSWSWAVRRITIEANDYLNRSTVARSYTLLNIKSHLVTT